MARERDFEIQEVGPNKFAIVEVVLHAGPTKLSTATTLGEIRGIFPTQTEAKRQVQKLKAGLRPH